MNWSESFRILNRQIIEAYEDYRDAINARTKLIEYARQQGMTLDAIADMAGITKQRIHQLLQSKDSAAS